jgi:hypothetical protein
VEPKTEIPAGRVQWRIRGPQASSDEDTNIVLDQVKTRCIQPMPLSFILKLHFMFYLVVH